MSRILIAVLVVIASAKADEARWVWGKGSRSQRAFSNDEVPKYENFYAREKDREPTTSRPLPGQKSQEDFLNPDDLRNYNGPPSFGYSPFGQGGGAPPNNYPPGYGTQAGANVPQSNPNGGFPYPGTQPGFPGAGGGYPGGFPQPSNNGFPNQAGYPNQVPVQGYPQTGPAFGGSQGGSFSGGFQGGFQGGYQGQGGFPGQGFGGVPYPQQVGGYPGQGGFPSQAGYPSQFAGGVGYPQGGGQPQIGQYVGCGQFGGCGQQAQHLGQYPGQYPYPYPGVGQYPYPEPFAHPHHAGNPYGVTPYNSNAGAQAPSPSDDYEDLSKNGTDNTNSALKVEGKTSNARSSQQKPSPPDTKLHKHKKAYE